MRSFEHATVEWFWTQPAGVDAPPSFVIYMPDGSADRRLGSNIEVTLALTELGRQGFETVACITAGNWILWTLKREQATN